MRVAYIVCNINKIGGTERAVNNIKNALKDTQDIEVFVISMFSNTKNSKKIEIDYTSNIVHLGLNNYGKLQRFNSYLKFVHIINQISKKLNLDIILGTTHAINCLLTFCNKSVRFIGCEHTIYNACPLISRKIRKKLYKKLDAVVLLTNSDANNYTFISAEKKFVIPNIISFEASERAPLTNKKIIAVGRLTSLKRYDKLIDMSKSIRKIIPDWKICIYGDGECFDSLKMQIKQENLMDYVFLMGNSNSIKEEILSSSIMVMTSEYEGLPMVLIEAQTCGLPIVSFDCPEGPRNIISNNIDGYLVPMDDEQSFIDHVVSLAKDNELRISMGKAAYESSQKYKPDIISQMWICLFKNVLEN